MLKIICSCSSRFKGCPSLSESRKLSTTSEFIRIKFENGVKEVTMCDTRTRNSLSIDMMKSLVSAINSDRENSALRAIIISAEGSVFSAGHNLKELADNKEKQVSCFQTASTLMNSIIDSPVPVIAQVDGIAAAAGCQLVAQCDLVISSDKSTFSTPGANFGIFCSTPGVALARCVNKQPALYMLLTGLPVPARDAQLYGLVTRVCSSGELQNEIQAICDAIKLKSREVIELGKKFYYKQVQYDVKTAYEMGSETMVENLQLPDCKEGIQSFIEKRKPQWKSEDKNDPL